MVSREEQLCELETLHAIYSDAFTFQEESSDSTFTYNGRLRIEYKLDYPISLKRPVPRPGNTASLQHNETLGTSSTVQVRD